MFWTHAFNSKYSYLIKMNLIHIWIKVFLIWLNDHDPNDRNKTYLNSTVCHLMEWSNIHLDWNASAVKSNLKLWSTGWFTFGNMFFFSQCIVPEKNGDKL